MTSCIRVAPCIIVQATKKALKLEWYDLTHRIIVSSWFPKSMAQIEYGVAYIQRGIYSQKIHEATKKR